MNMIDLNADIGEANTPEWVKAEADILSFVSSVNIACGGHAGDASSMRRTVKNALANNVVVGAHPAYPDKDNFGRVSMTLGKDISSRNLKKSLTQQIVSLAEIAFSENVELRYVKPHGALYNDAVKDAEKANIVAQVIYDIDPNLALLGGPHSEMEKAAKNFGLRFIAEGFIDRRYTDDGHLLSRAIDGAVLKEDAERISQAIDIAARQQVKTNSGDTLSINVGSLCVHGDSPGAVKTARKARKALENHGLTVKSFVT
jgi:UPF0271 protein